MTHKEWQAIEVLTRKVFAMAKELDDLKTAVDSVVAKVADLRSQVANAVNPADLVPLTQKLNDAVNPPAPPAA